MKKIKIGDIFEIKTLKGTVYLHYIYKDKVLGELIRILPGFHNNDSINFEELATKEAEFMVFFPLSFAYKKKIVHLVGSFVSNNFGKPKYMRTQYFEKGDFLGWHIIDTETWRREFFKNLDEEQKKLSPWGIWNDTLLIERLVNDWSLGNWV